MNAPDMNHSRPLTEEESGSSPARWLVTLGVIVLSGGFGYSLGMQRGMESGNVTHTTAADATLPYVLEEAGRRARASGDVETAQWFDALHTSQTQTRHFGSRGW